MKILHLLSDGQTGLSTKIIEAQKGGNEVKVIDMSKKDVSYETIIDEIFSNDRVTSW
ncbi:MAG: hypothetical protein HY805_01290 [Nitrospirae bacterium]|nr:hypothetical protein [Nitrospirota bacterium]